MTPKDKAEKIVYEMYNLGHNQIYFDTAKKCALIAVDEIMYALLNRKQVYWLQVKEEIEKL